MAGFEAGDEVEPAGEDEDGGAGYLGLFEFLSPGGLWGLNILSGSTVGLSQSSAGRGRLIKSSSSGTSRDREPMVVVVIAVVVVVVVDVDKQWSDQRRLSLSDGVEPWTRQKLLFLAATSRAWYWSALSPDGTSVVSPCQRGKAR